MCFLFFPFFFRLFFISWRLITLQYCSGICHTLTWISHGFTCISHPDPSSHLPLYPIPLGLPSAPAPSTFLMHPIWMTMSSLEKCLFRYSPHFVKPGFFFFFWCMSCMRFVFLYIVDINLIKYIVCKYILSLSRPFVFFDSFLHCARGFFTLMYPHLFNFPFVSFAKGNISKNYC